MEIMRKNRDVIEAQLAIELSHAQTLKSVAQIVRKYCSRTFGSRAGMFCAERDGRLRIIFQWRSGTISDNPAERASQGLIAQVSRTGIPFFRSGRRTGIGFLPIKNASEHTGGVLVVFLDPGRQRPTDAKERMSRFANIAGASILRAAAFDEAIAARATAERITERQADLLTVISHELRNPMTPILNWAVALSSGALSSEKQSVAIEAIIRNVRALNYLIDDLFDTARISSGKLRLEMAEMRIQEVAREALGATEQAAQNKQLRVTTDIAEGIPAFLADSRRIRQVLINLLNNAIKFTPEGGVITLKIRSRADSVECIITDTGRGIQSSFLPFAFERFRQEKRSSGSAGLGLGLSIVREIVELHRGSIKAHSPGANQGATFRFRLPLTTPPRHAGAAVAGD
ncbi:MAG TPA: HAMP domain-containing sensor histidine kinase [Terriglobia bacterium]|jgi:signal transduction histidine kinase